jgi:hypothetical protein
MMPLRAAALLLTLSAGQALAQPKTGQAQPDRLDFGTVYLGSTVEASFLVYEAGTDASIKLEVTAPKFVKVLKKETEARMYGPGNNFVSGSVFLAIDTAAAGDLKGEIRVKLGGTTAKVPISAAVKPRRKGLVRLLVPESPWDRHSTKDGGMFRAWTDLVKGAPLDASYLLAENGKPVLRDLDLGKYDCVLLSGGALVFLTAKDVKRLRAFAEAGGKVVVAANAFMVGSVPKANEVVTPYGLQMGDEETRDRTKKDVTPKWPDLDGVLVENGVKSARFFRASPVAVTDWKAGRVLVKASGVGRPGDGFVAVAKAGKGQVVALGEALWWSWISGRRTEGADNAKLLRWLLVGRKQG